VGTSPYHRDLTAENFAAIRRIYDRCVDIRRMGAASVDLAYVACGRVEAYFERNLKPWDFAAGKIIVEEAGGRVIDMEGNSANVMAPSDIIAGNGYIEEVIKKLLIER
jgi:myo-inositol-1(or 4)-monophosphatase